MCFGFGALTIRDRIHAIPFEIIPSTVGPLFRTSNFYFSGGPIARAGGPRVQSGSNITPLELAFFAVAFRHKMCLNSRATFFAVISAVGQLLSARLSQNTPSCQNLAALALHRASENRAPFWTVLARCEPAAPLSGTLGEYGCAACVSRAHFPDPSTGPNINNLKTGL